MNEKKSVDRRRFLGAGLAGLGLASAGGAAGWTWRRHAAPAKPERPPLGGSFTYDVSSYVQTDPALLRYDEAAPIPTGFHAPRCIEMNRQDELFVAGDLQIKVLDAAGPTTRTIALPERAQGLAHVDDGRLVVAYKERIEVRDAHGQVLAAGSVLPGKTHLTSVTVAGDTIFAADAGNREVLRCDFAGQVLGRFGRKGGDEGNPGFAIPSAYFDIELGADGLLWVTNTGRHQVEAYTLDGRFELGWGHSGQRSTKKG